MLETADHKDSLAEAVIKVIAFFDLLDWPLTAWEIKKNLDQPVELADILVYLAKSQPALAQKNGFYFLPGREELVTVRERKYNYFCRKLKIARRFSRLFSLSPSVKAVALANCLGDYNLRDGSDLDFFIITAPGRIWLSRLYCAGLAKILNRRPTARGKQDKLCLSFYVTEANLDLSGLRLAGDDPYFDYWLKNLILLYNKDKVYDKFFRANLARPPLNEATTLARVAPSLWEAWAKKFQLKIMPAALRAAINKSDGVVVSDQILKFYLRDRRREYAEKYASQIRKIFQAGAGV